MPEFDNPEKVLKRINQLREDHSQMRIEIATREALGMSYTNGRQWTTVATGVFGNTVVDSWDEDWDVKSSEVRVVNNLIGPLYRRVAASTNATTIEASVSPARHLKTFEAADQAAVAQAVLNGMAEDVYMTEVARAASSLRWQTGSSLIYILLSQKTKEVPQDVIRNPDGSPVEIKEQWLRWAYSPLSDLIWEPSNISPDLSNHTSLVLERIMTHRKFVQLYGPVDQFGLETALLPTMGELAPHYMAAAELTGTSFFRGASQQSMEKALRVSTLYETNPSDPDRWWLQFNVVDVTPAGQREKLKGTVMNMDDPVSPFGHHGRPIFKLDAFRRQDAVQALGLPHVLMGDQDRLNILESIKFQQLTAVVHGQWLLDIGSGSDADTLANQLNMGVGGILTWNSRSSPDAKPPEFVSPPPPRQEFITFGAQIGAGMREQVHISPINQGIGKTHIPKEIQQQLLSNSTAVVDTIIQDDADKYGDALKVTLGTLRNAMDRPGRIIARLRDRHGFTLDDLRVFHTIDPHNITMVVKVRQHSIISRSLDERVQQLGQALESAVITPMQYAIALAEELERPLMNIHEKQLQFCKSGVRHILSGMDWPGIPHLNLEIFLHVAEEAMWGLDLTKDQDRAAMKRLQEAVLTQKQLTQENTLPNPLDNQQGGGLSSSIGNQSPSPAPGGAPESINPLNNPVGASGGLPAGLSL